jgi:hypothetical protein
MYRWVPKFGPMAQCVVHALKGLACRARVTPASSPASHCKQCPALMSPFSPRARLRQSFLRTLRSQKHNIFSMGPKFRYPTVFGLSLFCSFRELMWRSISRFVKGADASSAAAVSGRIPVFASSGVQLPASGDMTLASVLVRVCT